jgi:hypothetical protein
MALCTRASQVSDRTTFKAMQTPIIKLQGVLACWEALWSEAHFCITSETGSMKLNVLHSYTGAPYFAAISALRLVTMSRFLRAYQFS